MVCAAFASLRMRAAGATPSDAGAMHPHGLAFAPRTVVPGAADGLGAVALRAPGSRIRAIRLVVAPAAPFGRAVATTVEA
jgi:hypothetical protein